MASRGINQVTVFENLGPDPEMRVLPSGGKVTGYSSYVEKLTEQKHRQREEKPNGTVFLCSEKLAEVSRSMKELLVL